MSRRRFLAVSLGATGAAALASCTSVKSTTAVAPTASATGPVAQEITLRARQAQIDLGGREATAWTFGDRVPGPAIRAKAGERVRITVANDLPEETSVHWHGLAIPNPMDGVPAVTTPAIASGDSFTYDFVVPDAGTHWFHPHTGLQLDTGLYAPFIVEDPGGPARYDHDWVLMLDDWTQGVGQDPQQIFDDLVAAGQRSDQGGMMHMGGMGMGSDGGDVIYPLYVINGRAATDPDVLRVRPGDRIRVRIINAAADTIFTVAVGGHRMTITHTDGYPVQPVDAQSLRIGTTSSYRPATASSRWSHSRRARVVTAWRFCAVPRAACPPIPFLPSSPPTPPALTCCNPSKACGCRAAIPNRTTTSFSPGPWRRTSGQSTVPRTTGHNR